MDRKVIITLSPSSSLFGKQLNPCLPEQPDEIVDEVYRSWNEGASIVHVHVRDPEGRPTNDVNIFRQVNSMVRDKCDIIIQNSIAPAVASGAVAEDGLQALDAMPEMASLDMGLSAITLRGSDIPILWTRTFLRTAAKMMLERGIKPELEIYHDGMMTEVEMLMTEGLLEKPYYLSYVMGMTMGQGKVPYTPKHLLHFLDFMPPDSLFSVIGIGAAQLPATTLSILLGGNARVGFEDNVYYRKGELATSNAQLVARTARIVQELGLEVASPEEARQMLAIPSRTREMAAAE